MEGPQGALQKNKPITPKQGRYIGETGKESKKRIVLFQGLSLNKKKKEIYKRPAKTTVKKKKS